VEGGLQGVGLPVSALEHLQDAAVGSRRHKSVGNLVGAGDMVNMVNPPSGEVVTEKTHEHKEGQHEAICYIASS
jgi:hypothetical protein